MSVNFHTKYLSRRIDRLQEAYVQEKFAISTQGKNDDSRLKEIVNQLTKILLNHPSPQGDEKVRQFTQESNALIAEVARKRGIAVNEGFEQLQPEVKNNDEDPQADPVHNDDLAPEVRVLYELKDEIRRVIAVIQAMERTHAAAEPADEEHAKHTRYLYEILWANLAPLPRMSDLADRMHDIAFTLHALKLHCDKRVPAAAALSSANAILGLEVPHLKNSLKIAFSDAFRSSIEPGDDSEAIYQSIKGDIPRIIAFKNIGNQEEANRLLSGILDVILMIPDEKYRFFAILECLRVRLSTDQLADVRGIALNISSKETKAEALSAIVRYHLALEEIALALSTCEGIDSGPQLTEVFTTIFEKALECDQLDAVFDYWKTSPSYELCAELAEPAAHFFVAVGKLKQALEMMSSMKPWKYTQLLEYYIKESPDSETLRRWYEADQEAVMFDDLKGEASLLIAESIHQRRLSGTMDDESADTFIADVIQSLATAPGDRYKAAFHLQMVSLARCISDSTLRSKSFHHLIYYVLIKGRRVGSQAKAREYLAQIQQEPWLSSASSFLIRRLASN